jgi:RND family efflux transporter MFP subunit
VIHELPGAIATAERAGARGWAWARWGVLVVVAAAVAAWFLLAGDGGDVAAGKGRGGGGPKPAPVTLAAVEVGAFKAHASWPGELDADAVDVSSLVSGRLTAVHVRLGDAVSAGQLLAAIDTSDLTRQRAEAQAQQQAAAAARQRAQVELKAAERELTRVRSLETRGIASAQELDARAADVAAKRAAVAMARAQEAEAEAGGATLDQRIAEARILAPFDGTVASRERDPGSFVAVGATIVRVVAHAPLRVRFEVPEAAIADLVADRPLSVTAPPTGAAAHPARVTGTAGEVVRDRRVVVVEGIVDDPPPSWLPGMYAEVEIVRRALSRATIVPATAILSRLEGDGEVRVGVFVADGDKARWVPIEVVAREGERAAVSGALDADARVLVSGHNDLADGSALLISGAAEETAAPGGADATGGGAPGAGAP